jgi:phage/plasmid-associated DNA primase
LCKENWYVLDYETQLWKKIKEPTYYIISEIRKYIDYSNAQIAIKMIGIDGEEKDKLILMQKEYLKYYTKINANGYISMCVKILRAQLVNDLFEDTLDTMPNIMAFQNGIMDLKTKVFRYGIKGDDNLTDTIKYDWTPPNLVKTEFVKSVLKKILNNNEEHMEYYLSVIGYSFIGMPQLEKSLYFMIDGTDNGKGDNGKTFFFDIMNTLMPYYVYKSKGSLLEEGNAKVHKQLCMTKGKRLVWLDEFSTKKTNAVLLKEIADGKTIENEVMFGTSESINILYKMFILSNHIPKVDPKEEAVYNRYKQISFGSHFDRSGNRKEENPEKLLFIADCYLSDKLKNEYYNEIFGLIIDYASKYYKTKLQKIPEKFYKDAKETKMKNDEFGMWFDENCGIDDEKRISIELLKEKSGFDDKLIKDGMKRMGFKYDKDISKMGKDKFGKHYKGGFEGCFYKDFIE